MKDLVPIALILDSQLAYPRGVLRGVKRFARRRPDWTLVIHQAGGMSRQVLETIRPAGIIAGIVSHRLLGVLQSQKMPVVSVQPIIADVPFPSVMVDHRQIGRMACEHLRNCGLENFGFVGHPYHQYSNEREAGFRESLAAVGKSFERYYERYRASYPQRARLFALRPSLHRWLMSLPKPAGVFACHDIWGVQIIEACRMLALRVPDEVAVVGVDNDDLLCELASPSLSSVLVPAEQIGFEAAVLLERLLNRGRRPKKPIVLPATGLVARQSSNILVGADADVVAALQFIRRQFHRPLRVEDVVENVQASRRSLEQKFRASLGCGIADEIIRTRLERARHLLGASGLSVTEIAEQTGFGGIYYFSRLFRERTGLTPTQFRETSRSAAHRASRV